MKNLRTAVIASAVLAAMACSSTSAEQTPRPAQTDVVAMQLVGASGAARAVGLDELPGKSNYFRGNDPGRWLTDVPNYARAEYQEKDR